MRAIKTFLMVVVLVILAFGVGYGLGYIKLKTAEKEWAAAKDEMKSKIATLEREWTRAKARETLWDISDALSQIIVHISERNFGLAGKTLEGLKETFTALQPNMNEEWRAKLGFFLPAIEEIKKEVEKSSPEAKKKIEDLKNLFEQSLRPFQKGEEGKKG